MLGDAMVMTAEDEARWANEGGAVDYGAATRAVARAEALSDPAADVGDPAGATEAAPQNRVPKSVAIVAMGSSMADYLSLATNLGGKHTIAEEIWAIGQTAGVIQYDRCFMMNDIVEVRRILTENPQRTDIKNCLEWLATARGPVYCSNAHPDYPALVEYPLLEVIKTLKLCYLNGSVAFAIGLAIHLGVETIGLFGCDFTYPDNHIAEKGRACVEFWLAYFSLKGGTVQLAPNTNIMDHNVPPNEKLYGFGGKVSVVVEDGVYKMLREPASSAVG